jgi:hypothetical protein
MLLQELSASKSNKRDFISILGIIEDNLLYGYIQNNSNFDPSSKLKGERVRACEKYLKQVKEKNLITLFSFQRCSQKIIYLCYWGILRLYSPRK